MIRQTHTYATLEVPNELYAFVYDKLAAAGYDHAFDQHDGKPVIDMSGIALAPLAVILSGEELRVLKMCDDDKDTIGNGSAEEREAFDSLAKRRLIAQSKLPDNDFWHTTDEGKLALRAYQPVPIPMFLACPVCHAQHIDAPDPATDWTNPPHRTHRCAECKTLWRPAAVHTTGVSTEELGRILGVPANAIAASGATGP